ncbi:MAG: sulfatase [Myxococcota bacterium]
MVRRSAAWIALLACGAALALRFTPLAANDRVARVADRLGGIGWIDRLYVARELDALAEAAAPAGAPRPHVVLVSLDTLRRDRLGLYGYDHDTMPRLAAWARSARVYDRARSSSSWTLPAHASLFTGLHAVEHGAHGAAYTPGAPSDGDALALREDVPTLAEALGDAGYTTVGIAANRAYLGASLGLSRGFDLWLCDRVPRVGAYPTADRVTSMALQVAEELRDRPLFLFLNYMDPHQPIHLRDGYTPEIERVDRELLPYTERWMRHTERLMREGEPLSPALVESWSLGYDGELRFLDEHLGRLLDGLSALGVGGDDVVIVLSDHGELFGEHDLVEHSKHLYDALTLVPLLVRAPGFAAGRDGRPVQPQDVTRWVLAAAGLPAFPGTAPTGGLQVTELYWTRHKDLADPALRARFDRVLRAWVEAEHKLFRDDRGGEWLYDLAADPAETRPLSDAPWAGPLRRRAADWVGEHAPAPGAAPPRSDVEIEALRALGYVE